MTRRIVAMLFLLWVGGMAAAQPLPHVASEKSESADDLLADLPHPLDRKDAARAKFAASRAEVLELQKAKLDAAQSIVESRFKEFWNGRGNIYLMVSAILSHADAAETLSTNATEKAAIAERRWEFAYACDLVNQARYDAGRVGIRDYLQFRVLRHNSELILRQSWAGLVQKGTKACVLFADPGDEFREYHPLHSRQKAAAKFEAAQADPRAMVKELVDTLQLLVDRQYGQCLVGYGSWYLLQVYSLELATARLLASSDAAAQLACLEVPWEVFRKIERITRFRYDAGRVPIQSLARCQNLLLQAQLSLLDARSKFVRAKSGGNPRKYLWPSQFPEIEKWFPEDELFTAKASAKDQYQLSFPNRKELLREKRAAAQDNCFASSKEYLAGRGGLFDLLDGCLHLLEAELTMSDSEAAQQAALDRHWSRVFQIEQISQFRHSQGHIPLQDQAAARYHLLDAELWLKQFQATKKLPTASPLRLRIPEP